MAKDSKKEFLWKYSLIRKQRTMLSGKDDSLSELYNLCENDSQRDLISDLLIRFDCIDDSLYDLALRSIAKRIAALKYEPTELAVVALCHDSNADSSQAVLHDLRLYVANETGNTNIPFINRFEKIASCYNTEHRKHFIAVDEFSGSGQTILNRNREFLTKKLPQATIDFFLIAAMSNACVLIREAGINLGVELLCKAGISGYYLGNELQKRVLEMKRLEGKLASKIGQLDIQDFSFGYGHAEALFWRRERNVPNNVFPIFWWKHYLSGGTRTTLLTRLQNGY